MLKYVIACVTMISVAVGQDSSRSTIPAAAREAFDDQSDIDGLNTTTIFGNVLYEDGSPAVGAQVTLVDFGDSAIVGLDGTFAIEVTLPHEPRELALVATLTRGEQELFGSVSGFSGMRGFAIAPILFLRPLCDAAWLGGEFCLPGLNGTAFAAVSWDDGSGEALYVGGSFTVAGCSNAINVARWDGESWSSLTGLSGISVDNKVLALTVFDDGTGPALYAGGEFTSAGGVTANYVARWDGSEWSPLTGPSGTGVSNWVRALTVFDDGSGPALYVGGDFFTAGGVAVNFIARWDGSEWSPLIGPSGTGTNNSVRALAVYDDGSGPALYAAGTFSSAGGIGVSRIGRWNGTTWSRLFGPSSTGVVGEVFALAVFDDGMGPALYAAGLFPTAGGITVNNIARWDGNAWSPLTGTSGTGTNSFVYALGVIDDGIGPALYAGGSFTSAGGVSVNRIARWDGTDWSATGSPPGAGINVGHVYALTSFEDESGASLIACGQFSLISGVNVNNIASLSNGSWRTVSGPSGSGPLGAVTAMTVFDDGSEPALYAAGTFPVVGGLTVNRIARWNGHVWSPLTGPSGTGVNNLVRTLAVFDDGSGPALYAGGSFQTAGGVTVNRIARWDGTDWSALTEAFAVNVGVNNAVHASTVFDDGSGPALYLGGDFNLAGDVDALAIAKWDGSTWSALPGALGTGQGGGPASVGSLTVFDDGSGPALYVGGNFTIAGGLTVNRIAKWDGHVWTPLTGPSGTGVSDSVNGMSVFNDGTGPALFVGGQFTTAGGMTVNRIAKWDGTVWSPLSSPSGTGVSSLVNALLVFNDGSGPALLVGGQFVTAGGQTVNRIAKWDGNIWSPLEGPSGTGVIGGGGVSALSPFDDGSGPALYVGGSFDSAGGIPSSSMAKWGRDCSSRSSRLLAGDDTWQDTIARRVASAPQPATQPAPTEPSADLTLNPAAPQRLAADGSRRSTIARLASARVIEASEAEVALDRVRDPLANTSGQRIENRPAEDGTLRAFLIEPDGREIALPTLGGTAARGEGLSSLGDVVGLSTTADGRIEGFVWRYDAGQIESIGTLGGPGSAAMLWLGPVVVLGDADDASPEARAALWTPADGLLDLNTLIEPGSGVTLVRPLGVLENDTVLVEARTASGQQVHVALDVQLYEALPTDLDGNGVVDFFDVLMLLDQIGQGPGAMPDADLNADGLIDAIDVMLMLDTLGHEAARVGGSD